MLWRVLTAVDTKVEVNLVVGPGVVEVCGGCMKPTLGHLAVPVEAEAFGPGAAQTQSLARRLGGGSALWRSAVHVHIRHHVEGVLSRRTHTCIAKGTRTSKCVSRPKKQADGPRGHLNSFGFTIRLCTKQEVVSP